MFRVNGIELDNPDMGWICRDESTVVSSLDVQRSALVVPGRDGVVPVDGWLSPPIVPIHVETPRANQGALRALFMRSTITLTEDGQTGIEAACELMSITPPATWGPADEVVELRAMLRIPGVYWRDTTASTSSAAAISSASIVAEVMAGLSGPVRDAIVRVKGGASGLRVTDSEGSWFEYTASLASGDYLRFEAATGRAFVTSSDTWTGGTEVTGDIDNGPGPYYLELSPTFTDPATRVAKVTVTTTERTGSPTIEIRGKRAHAV